MLFVICVDTAVNLLERNEEIGGPHWQFAAYPYDIDAQGSGNIVTTYKKASRLSGDQTKVWICVEIVAMTYVAAYFVD